MKAGDHKGQPHYRQRDTEGDSETYLYKEHCKWLVSDSLGEPAGWLKNSQNTALPPTGGWQFWNFKKAKYDNDTSLILEFTSFFPNLIEHPYSCQTMGVSGKGEVVEDQGGKLGEYR